MSLNKSDLEIMNEAQTIGHYTMNEDQRDTPNEHVELVRTFLDDYSPEKSRYET